MPGYEFQFMTDNIVFENGTVITDAAFNALEFQ